MRTSLTVIALALILAACGRRPAAQTEIVPEPPAPTVEPGPPAAGDLALPAEPVEVNFTAADGQALSGLYYPAADNPAPLVVLMHWINGDKSDWYEIAPWLQNRGLINRFPNGGDQHWWDPNWFPAVPAGRSYGVFIFSFRGCLPMDQRGCAGFDEAAWLMDAQAAMQTALTLAGVDPARIVAIGSSIGADGAIDGCAWLNQQQPGACRGALSLSPGGYLTIAYKTAVHTLKTADPNARAWCLADGSEIYICNAAQDVGAIPWEIPSGQHGNMLLRPNLDPLPMLLILDFLGEALN